MMQDESDEDVLMDGLNGRLNSFPKEKQKHESAAQEEQEQEQEQQQEQDEEEDEAKVPSGSMHRHGSDSTEESDTSTGSILEPLMPRARVDERSEEEENSNNSNSNSSSNKSSKNKNAGVLKKLVSGSSKRGASSVAFLNHRKAKLFGRNDSGGDETNDRNGNGNNRERTSGGGSSTTGRRRGGNPCSKLRRRNGNSGSPAAAAAGNRPPSFQRIGGFFRNPWRRNNSTAAVVAAAAVGGQNGAVFCRARCDGAEYHRMAHSTTVAMNIAARLLIWATFLATTTGIFWYSWILVNNKADPHLIAWFSAGGLVILGFLISMYGIIMHLSNYNQPNVQCYVVRILWMVPIYSVESWLCLRFHRYAIYIETLRDFYESYVLFCFLRFLMEVLGGEEALVLMLKDKSPTRGVHMVPLNWCMKPWIMGQPLSRRTSYMPLPLSSPLDDDDHDNNNDPNHDEVDDIVDTALPADDTNLATADIPRPKRKLSNTEFGARPVKKIQWTSPFFVQCKFGVLQYVLLKFVCALATVILENYGLYKEGKFTPTGGYLYVCILTNLSQCWALYCLIFFYYATVNELSPIRPVGKFLSVKAVVFFTWWQSVCISILFQMGMIPSYVTSGTEWSEEAVAKGLQDYLICIEMFIAAVVHTFVFPHTDYLTPIAGLDRSTPNPVSTGGRHHHPGVRRIGRKNRSHWNQYGWRDDRSACSKNSTMTPEVDLELGPTSKLSSSPVRRPLLGASDKDATTAETSAAFVDTDGAATAVVLEETLDDIHEPFEGSSKDIIMLPLDNNTTTNKNTLPQKEEGRIRKNSKDVNMKGQQRQQQQQQQRPGFVRAFLDSTFPGDVVDNTVGIVKGDFHVEKQTLLHHAATSDEYDLFSNNYKRRRGGPPFPSVAVGTIPRSTTTTTTTKTTTTSGVISSSDEDARKYRPMMTTGITMTSSSSSSTGGGAINSSSVNTTIIPLKSPKEQA